MQQLINQVRNHYLIRKYPTFKQMIKFAIVGSGNTVVDFSVYFSLTRIFLFWRSHYLWANFIAFSLAATFSYFFNRTWTFRDKSSRIHLQYFKFFIVSIIGLILAESILYLAVDFLNIYDLLAKILVVFIVFFWNFSANKFWTFRAK